MDKIFTDVELADALRRMADLLSRASGREPEWIKLAEERVEHALLMRDPRHREGNAGDGVPLAGDPEEPGIEPSERERRLWLADMRKQAIEQEQGTRVGLIRLSAAGLPEHEVILADLIDLTRDAMEQRNPDRLRQAAADWRQRAWTPAENCAGGMGGQNLQVSAGTESHSTVCTPASFERIGQAISGLGSAIGAFIEATSKYLRWRNLGKIQAHGRAPVAAGSQAEATMLAEMQAQHEQEMDARDVFKAAAERLVPMLVASGHDAAGVLKLRHYIVDGGGPDNAYSIWPDVKVQLQLWAIPADPLAALREMPDPLEQEEDAPAAPRTGDGMAWQDARDKMQAHLKRNPWPGVNAFARLLKCSSSTVSKAIDNTPRLKSIRAEAEAARDGGIRGAMGGTLEGTVDAEALDPSEAAGAATDALFARLLDDANEQERAWLNGLSDAERAKLERQLGKMDPNDRDTMQALLRSSAFAGGVRERSQPKSR